MNNGSYVWKRVGWMMCCLVWANSIVERECRLLAFPTREQLLPGASQHLKRWKHRFVVWQRKVWLPLRLVCCWEIRRVLVRWKPWLALRFSDFLRRTVRFRLSVLDALGLAPSLPEDMYFLIKKAVAIRKHLERNRKDRDSKFRLIMVESRIHRLTRYYKRTEQLPPTWK